MFDLAGGFDAVLAGHADVHENDVGVVLSGEGDRFGAVGGFAEHCHVVGHFDKDSEPAPDQGLGRQR